MRLRQLLQDSKAINILKITYDNEILDKKYSINLTEICQKIPVEKNKETETSILRLTEQKLITTDPLKNDKAISITNKGKEFIETLDHMMEILEGKKTKTKSVRVVYELTTQEKKTLVMTNSISKEIGSEYIALKSLVMELFPHHDYKTRIGIISKTIKRLEELNLMQTTKQNKRIYLKVTAKGEKTIKEQRLRSIVYN